MPATDWHVLLHQDDLAAWQVQVGLPAIQLQATIRQR